MTTPGMGAGPSSSGASSKRNASPAGALTSGSAGSSSISVGAMSQARSVYAPGGMTHVRTFRIFEAIKIDDGVWGAAH